MFLGWMSASTVQFSCLGLGHIAAVFFCIAICTAYHGCRLRCLEHRRDRQKNWLTRMACHDQSSTLVRTHASRHDFRGPSRQSSTSAMSPKLRLLPEQTSCRSSLEAVLPHQDLSSDATARIKNLGRLTEHLAKLDQAFSAAAKPARRLRKSFSANDALTLSNSSRQMPRSVKSMHNMAAIQTSSRTSSSMKRSQGLTMIGHAIILTSGTQH